MMTFFQDSVFMCENDALTDCNYVSFMFINNVLCCCSFLTLPLEGKLVALAVVDEKNPSEESIR